MRISSSAFGKAPVNPWNIYVWVRVRGFIITFFKLRVPFFLLFFSVLLLQVQKGEERGEEAVKAAVKITTLLWTGEVEGSIAFFLGGTTDQKGSPEGETNGERDWDKDGKEEMKQTVPEKRSVWTSMEWPRFPHWKQAICV